MAPIALLGGLTFAGVREFQRRRKERTYAGGQAERVELSGARSLAMGTGIGVGLTALMFGSRLLSRSLGGCLAKSCRETSGCGARWDTPFSLGALGAALYYQWYRITTKIEGGTGKIEAAFDTPPRSSFVSGSDRQPRALGTLGREGRRHIFTVLPKAWIEQIMGEPAIDPIRVYVGLDSADTEEERVSLAIEELAAHGRFRSRAAAGTSPTGTGYVNYVTVECVEYLTRGNCATVTLQYSKRPSPLSLDRVWEGRKQFRLLLAAIRRVLYQMPPETPPAARRVRREPGRTHQPGRLSAHGHPGAAGRRSRARPVDWLARTSASGRCRSCAATGPTWSPA